jgi:MHS family proline/betaine transporter-like MFS transporter
MSRVTRALRNARSEPATGRSASGRALVAASVGNLVEWYDFAVYGAFATIIAVTYFPGADPAARLLASFAVFATAFPPGYATIGMLAPLLLILLRSAQGLSVGGETGGATAFVVEYAPADRRGWYAAWLWATLALGVASGIGMAILLARVFSRATLEGWGWRLAFLVTLPLGLVGLYLRLRLDETPRFRAAQRARAVARRPVTETVRGYPGRLLVGFGLVAALALTFNLFFFYLPSHLVTALAIPLPRALAASLVGLGLVAVAAPVLGRLSDLVGRKPLLVAGTLVLLVVTLPAFLLIRRAGPFGLPMGYALVGLPLSCLAIVPPFLAELFPTPIRSTALAITYGLGSALFGGTAPFLATLLLQRTGNPVAPAYYAAAVIAAAAGALLTRETAFQPLDAGGLAGRESIRLGQEDRRSR